MFFENVKEGPRDAVFGMMGAFKEDARSKKVNLMVGVYKNAELKNEMMPVVKLAKSHPLPDASLADYLPMDGCEEMLDAIGPIIFGEKIWVSQKSRIYGAQALGGTNALRIGAEFLAQEIGKTIYIPEPSWPNHRSIFERALFRVETYPYFDRNRHAFDNQSFLRFLETVPEKSIILMHASCHNPTGSDPSVKDWGEIAHLMKKRQLLAFFDFAYQGLGDGLDEDAAAIRIFANLGMDFLIAYSCSKNFSMYCQRVGALFVISPSDVIKKKIASQVKRIIRTNYSNPPAHGAFIVAHILRSELKNDWQKQLSLMRERLVSMRKEFVERLLSKQTKVDYRPLLQHKGMFSFVDLNSKQVGQLIDKYAVYMLDNGRINVAGINHQNIDYIVDSIIAVS